MNKKVTEELCNKIRQYFFKKKELDEMKKVVDADNADIKKIMLDNDIEEQSIDNITAKTSVSQRETINEDALIELLKAKGYAKGIVKKKEYIDSDALEKAIYNETIDKDTLVEMNKCKKVTEVVTLRVTMKKSKEA